MISTDQVRTLLDSGGNVVGTDGDKIGSIGQIFLDDETGQPEWVTVKTGLFGGSESFVPLADGSISGDDIAVPFSKSKVKDAPRVDDSDGHLSPDQEAELYAYYGLEYTSATGQATGQATGPVTDEGTGRTTDASYGTDTSYGTDAGDVTGTRPDHSDDVQGHDTSGPTTDDAMTRSEERLHVGKETVTTGKARLRKYVVTENVTQTVPVSHEEVRLEREPITGDNRDEALSGADLSSEEHEVTLTEERVAVNKETVPVERVKLGTETVTQEQQVDEQVAKEEIELDDSGLPSGTRPSR